MLWIIPALTAPFINAVNNFLDKYLVSGAIKNPKVLPVYLAVFSFFVGTAVWAGFGFFRPSIFALFGIASGITTVVAAIAYFKLMSQKDVSEMIFYIGLTTPFILILSYIFLGERISASQLAGFALILLAVALISFKKEEARFKLTKTLALILTVDGMWALGAVLMKFAINENSFIHSISYEGWGMALGGIGLYAFSSEIKKSFGKDIIELKKSAIFAIGANQLFSYCGKMIEYFAYSIGPVALVSVVGGTQTFYCIFLAVVLTLMFPLTFKENISKDGLLKKIIAAIILMAGLYFINK